ncbi:MAG: hypothetical protein ACEQR4_06190, partial [Rhodoluna sp.]
MSPKKQTQLFSLALHRQLKKVRGNGFPSVMDWLIKQEPNITILWDKIDWFADDGQTGERITLDLLVAHSKNKPLQDWWFLWNKVLLSSKDWGKEEIESFIRSVLYNKPGLALDPNITLSVLK